MYLVFCVLLVYKFNIKSLEIMWLEDFKNVFMQLYTNFY